MSSTWGARPRSGGRDRGAAVGSGCAGAAGGLVCPPAGRAATSIVLTYASPASSPLVSPSCAARVGLPPPRRSGRSAGLLALALVARRPVAQLAIAQPAAQVGHRAGQHRP